MAANLPGPRSLPGEIGRIPPSAVHGRLRYSIMWEKFGTIWKLKKKKKKKHESPREGPGAKLAFPTGSFILCRFNLGAVGWKCCRGRGLGLIHSPFLFLDWNTVLHIFLKDIIGLIGNKSIPTIGTTPPSFGLIQQGWYSWVVKSEGSGVNSQLCYLLAMSPWAISLISQHLSLLIYKMGEWGGAI